MLTTIILLILIIIALVIVMAVGFIRSSAKIEFYEEWITLFKKNTNSIYEEMNAIDERGSFESDDEVGVIFASLRDLIRELNRYIIGENTENK